MPGCDSSNRPGCASAPELLLDNLPIDILKESIDVLTAFAGLVVEQEGMLPNVHDKNRFEARRHALLM